MAGIGATFKFLVFKIIQYFGTLLTNFIFRGPNENLAPIREDCLLASAKNLALRIRTKKISSAEAVRACIRRIEEINDTSNCVVNKRFEKALEEAEAIDRLLADSTKTPEEIEKETPFLGVPFTVKDGIGIQGLVQAVGVVSRKSTLATEDTEAVAELRKAGAIPLGTTNVPEMMSWCETNNKAYGRTNNPYHSKYLVGGSSGGEAALLSAAGSIMGLGSDVGGSIRNPAFMCGIFGHKPSPNVVPSNGVIPDIPRMVIGPMSKFAEDLLPMLKVLSKSSKVPLKLNEPVDIKNLKFYILEESASSLVDAINPDISDMMKSIVDYLYKTHGITVKKVSLPLLRRVYHIWWAMMTREDGSFVKNKGNLIANFIKTGLGLTEHTLEMEFIGFLQKGRPAYGSKAHQKLIKDGETLTEEFEKLLGEDGVLLHPPYPVPPQRHCHSFFHPANFVYTAVFNITDMPVTQVPIKQTEEGLPIGVQVAASKNHDRLTIAVAEELEKAFGGWKPPPSQPKW